METCKVWGVSGAMNRHKSTVSNAKVRASNWTEMINMKQDMLKREKNEKVGVMKISRSTRKIRSMER